MKVPEGITYKHAEVERVAAKDPARPALEDPYLDAESGTLVATDSYVLVAIPVEVGPDDVSGWVPADALKAARKARTPDVALLGEYAVVDTNGARVQLKRRNDRGEYPKWRMLIPADEGRDELVVSYNAEKLVQVAKALGTPELTFRIPTDVRKPAVVTPNRQDDTRFALVMPINLKARR